MNLDQLNRRLALVFKRDIARDEKGRFASVDSGGGSGVGEKLSSLPRANPGSNDYTQPGVKSLDDLYAKASEGKTQYDAMMNNVKEGLPGAKTMEINSGKDYANVLKELESGSKDPVVIIAGLKGRDRTEEKVRDELNGDPSKVGDLVRGTIAVNSINDMPAVLDKLKESGIKLAREPKDRFSNPTGSGYRDVLLNVEMPNGHIGELQINTKAMFLAKDAGHKLYERERSISPKIENGTATKKERGEFRDLQTKQREIYASAWKKSK